MTSLTVSCQVSMERNMSLLHVTSDEYGKGATTAIFFQVSVKVKGYPKRLAHYQCAVSSASSHKIKLLQILQAKYIYLSAKLFVEKKQKRKKPNQSLHL